MRYDPDNREYYFNKEMIMSPEEKKAFSASFEEWRRSCLNDPAGHMAKSLRNSSASPAQTIFGAVMAVVLIGGILGIIGCIIMRRYEFTTLILSIILLVFGIGNLIMNTDKSDAFIESVTYLRIEGVIMIAGAVAIVITYTSHNTPLGLLIASLTGLLVMTLKTVGFKTSSKTVYKEEISARCTGYVRRMVSSGDEISTPENSPVFEYFFEGEKYRACYDNFTAGYDGTIKVDSECKIRIDPKSPWRIMGVSKNYLSGPVAGALICLAGVLVILYFLLAG